MERKCVERELKQRIQTGTIRREDVTRRLAELAFGKANDCVRLALEDEPKLDKLDLSLLSEVKRNDKGTVEIKLIDRLQALEQLATVADGENPEGGCDAAAGGTGVRESQRLRAAGAGG